MAKGVISRVWIAFFGLTMIAGLGLGIHKYLGRPYRAATTVDETANSSAPNGPPSIPPAQSGQAEAGAASESTSATEPPNKPSISIPDSTNCYDLSVLNETTEERRADKERRERVEALLAEKFDAEGINTSLSGSDEQELTFAGGAQWPEEEEFIRSFGGRLEKAMISARSTNDFCDADFARARFIAVDDQHHSIHVLWALSITKDAYRNITLEDRVTHDVAGTGQ